MTLIPPPLFSPADITTGWLAGWLADSLTRLPLDLASRSYCTLNIKCEYMASGQTGYNKPPSLNGSATTGLLIAISNQQSAYRPPAPPPTKEGIERLAAAGSSLLRCWVRADATISSLSGAGGGGEPCLASSTAPV